MPRDDLKDACPHLPNCHCHCSRAPQISALGHNLTRKGIWGSVGRYLCLDTTRKVFDTVCALRPSSPVRYIVISTEGVDRPDGRDPHRGRMERVLLWLLKYVLPPHADNMANIAYLGTRAANPSPFIDFCAVRPSDMIDADPSPYNLHTTLQNGIFNAGVTSRANVGRFMADLVTDSKLWRTWKGGYPHILNEVPPEKSKTKKV